MKYFIYCDSLDELKLQYRELAKQYHPDLNPEIGDEIMKEVNNEYDFASAKLAKQSNDESMHFEAAVAFREQINKIIHLPVLIEIVGSWIWITGDTKPVKQDLKGAGYYWAHKKMAWYWYPEGFGGGRGTNSLDELRNKYGSQKVTSTMKYQIN